MKPIITLNNSIAVDTNVLLYLHDKSDDRKRRIAENILADNPKIPAQVISEYLNVTRRLLDLPKAEVVRQCADLLKDCEIISVAHQTLMNAANIINRHKLPRLCKQIVLSYILKTCNTVF